MSRIPKLPNSAVKENRPGIANRPLSRTVVNGLSEADKKSLIMNHTRPLRNGPAGTLRNGPTSSVSVTSSFRSGPTSFAGSLRNGPSSSVSVAAGPRLKRSATIPPAAAIPPKNARIEKKPTTTTNKIAPYDFKAKFHDLLEKHKVVKSELIDLKDKHVEVADENEKIKETIQTSNHERDILREKLFSVKNELSEKTSEYVRLKLEYDIQKRENEDLHSKTKILAEITESLRKKSVELDTLQAEFNDLTRRYNALKEETEALRVLTDHLKKISVEYDKLQLDHKESLQSVANYKSDAESLQNILAGMYREQRDLRNTIQDLKGNIRVYCRVRPPLESELSRPQFNLNLMDACTIEVEKIELNSAVHSSRKGKAQHNFTFDGIFSRHSTQDDIFAEVSPMIQSALDGYNVCIFAYGQTGSGKTYTMEGGCGTEQYGIIPRAFNMIFTCMEDLKKMGWELTIKASFLEIYNEIIYDLLNSSKDQENHEIKMVNSKGTDVYVSNLKEEEVTSSHDFIGLMIFAQRNRQTAATLNNERSSRSHSVTQIKISAINEKRKEKFMSNLNLVDLAGSESGKTTQRMDETKHINRSLSELSKVILSLQTNQSHVPYRNSKLTHLLMPSLGGNSKTLMLVNINQFDDCFGETLNSLRFATKVNNCRVVKAKKNITMVDSV